MARDHWQHMLRQAVANATTECGIARNFSSTTACDQVDSEFCVVFGHRTGRAEPPGSPVSHLIRM
jgi:hypothetical protein